MKKIQLYLPQASLQQICLLAPSIAADLEKDASDKQKPFWQVSPLTQFWQSSFCQSIGWPSDSLPWTQLRLTQFELGENVETAYCCDPVLMQMTHQGAYMLGQNLLPLSHNEAIRVVAQINERLMRAGEQLFMLDRFSWLYTSETSPKLSSLSIDDLQGKDIYNYPYTGDDAAFWQQLSTEIQMLMKEMVDYQGLTEPPPETLLNVHFSAPVVVKEQAELPFINDDSLLLVSDNEIIKTLCLHSMLAHQSIEELKALSQNQTAASKQVMIAFDSEKENYGSLLELCLQQAINNQTHCVIVCQDAKIEWQQKSHWFSRLLAKLKF